MKLQLVSVGKQLPSWTQTGFDEYWRRLSNPLIPKLTEIAAVKRSKNQNADVIKQLEGQAIISQIPQGCHIVACDEHGTHWDTIALAQQMKTWLELGTPVAILIGGADGLSPDCLRLAKQTWSLSKLTFPHTLARLIVAEQLYRAQSILNNHPYHRA